MKKNKLLLLVLFIFLYSCSSSEYWKLRLEVSEKASLNLDQFQEIAITNFLVKKDTIDFNINDEIKDYFTFELGQNMDKKISSKDITIDKEELFEEEGFWKDLSSELPLAVLFTGSVEYSEETRRALLKIDKKRFDDPFPSETKLAKRTFYTLHFNLYLIDAQSGKTLYKRNFKESKSYKNPNQTAHFAFFDLIQNVKDKLFSKILGRDRIQERYLIK